MKLLANYFGEISRDTGKFCFGVRDTLYALESGAVEELIVYENLDCNRYTIRHPTTSVEKVIHLNEEQEKDTAHFTTDEGLDYEIIDKVALLEWFANNFKEFGAKLHIVTNRSQEGSQFCRGFGGIGGLLRYQLDFNDLDAIEEADDEFGL